MGKPTKRFMYDPETQSVIEVPVDTGTPREHFQVGVHRDGYTVSKSLPLNYRYHKGPFNAAGEPVITSKRMRDETIARANDHGENLSWD